MTDKQFEIQRKTVREWLAMQRQWRIPVYQRHYAWDADEKYGPTRLFYEEVKKQALRRLDYEEQDGKFIKCEKSLQPHYFGAVLVEEKQAGPARVQQFDVVDGQQRLTTINVALFSLIGQAMKNGLGDTVKKDLAEYIFTDVAKSESKLYPTNFDQAQYNRLLIDAYPEFSMQNKKRVDKHDKSMVVIACHFFNERFERFIENCEQQGIEVANALNALCEALLGGFALVVIPLVESDEAQMVFESMNNTARRLTMFDLIRNNIFYRADKEKPGRDVELFDGHLWDQFEQPFWEEKFNKSEKHIEMYVKRMLVAKTRKYIETKNNSAVFRDYKDFASLFKKNSGNVITGDSVEAEIAEISDYVDIYKYLVGESSMNPVSAPVGSEEFDFGYFKQHYATATLFFPVLFIIAKCEIDSAEKQRMVKLLESWHIRRLLCGQEMHNREIPKICAELGKSANYETLHSFVHAKDGEAVNVRDFPNHAKIASNINTVDMYNSRGGKLLAGYVFEKIFWHFTNPSRVEFEKLAKLTIDHVFPQTWEDTEWANLVQDFEGAEVEQKINTLGNLALMARGTNAAKSNKPWSEAREIIREYCTLEMTRKIAEKTTWDIAEIDARNKKLAVDICEVWPENIK